MDEDLTTTETKDGSEDKYPRKAAAIVSINAAIVSIAYTAEDFTLGRAHLIEEKREDNLQDVSQVSPPIKPQQEPR